MIALTSSRWGRPSGQPPAGMHRKHLSGLRHRESRSSRRAVRVAICRLAVSMAASSDISVSNMPETSCDKNLPRRAQSYRSATKDRVPAYFSSRRSTARSISLRSARAGLSRSCLGQPSWSSNTSQPGRLQSSTAAVRLKIISDDSGFEQSCGSGSQSFGSTDHVT
jgi:hypothetical protein